MSATALIQCIDQPFATRSDAVAHRNSMQAEHGGHWSTIPCPNGEHFHVHRDTRARRAAEHNRRTRRAVYAA